MNKQDNFQNMIGDVPRLSSQFVKHRCNATELVVRNWRRMKHKPITLETLADLKLRSYRLTAHCGNPVCGRSMTGAIDIKGRGQGMATISANSTLKPLMNNALVVATGEPEDYGTRLNATDLLS
ncbi:hypothetical protein [Roseibium sp. TrichSKD4]|uniref:hypothetical protein n=1 Tax=Roseibium sp. TrichSKD4 TaxID=744980 RepID=UPI00058CC0F3|nr:hypothetical protein [Roseibium sp. TrichSKD4]